MRLFLVLPLLLSGCAFFGTPQYSWYYEGPDMSERTVGPIIVSAEQMRRLCYVDAYGCMVPAQNAIYLRADAERNYRHGHCGLPKNLPRTSEEHEWCHAKGWRH